MNTNSIMALCKPPIYTKTKVEFWNDEHISKQMLQAHLDPEFDGASRKMAFIEKSAAWINQLLPPCQYPNLLDCGCGPGIYGERFAKAGYQVTGVDFSKRSIEYAKQTAKDHNLDITYLYQNYLQMDLTQCFDLCTMIYCDYGALSTDDRALMLKTVYDHLKPGGKFLFDVFTLRFLDDYKERQFWEVCPNGGFWRGDEHMALHGYYKYGENVVLQQVLVLAGDNVTPYYLWDTCYTKDTIMKETESAGFKVCKIFGDIAGSPYDEKSKTMAILLEKPEV